MKKSLILGSLLAGLLFSSPAYAQDPGWAISASVSARETVRHADQSYSVEYYYTEDGHVPNGSDTPFALMEHNGIQATTPNHPPNCSIGKVWVLIKVLNLNVGEVKTQKTSCSAVELPFCSEKGGYLLDVSRLPAGNYPIGLSVVHNGGEVTFQVLIFLFRSQREVQDQTGFWLRVYDPDRRWKPQELSMFPYMPGAEPSTGLKPFAKATGRLPELKMVQAPNQNPPTPLQGEGSRTVTIFVFENRMRTKNGSGSFSLHNVDGSLILPSQTGSRLVFNVQPGQYRIFAPDDQKGKWECFPSTPGHIYSVDKENIEINVSRRER